MMKTDDGVVFIGYHNPDYPNVHMIVKELHAQGIRTWIDRLNLPPGRLFQDEVELVLRTCRAAALFVGPEGVGPWERIEIRALISQFVRRSIPVIPVLMDVDAVPAMPLFLGEFCVARVDTTDPATGISDLIWGITGEKR
jgi:hypothetical protein